MALTGLLPNMRVDIKEGPPAGLNCSNVSITTNTDVSDSVGDAVEQSLIHDDIEDAYACCVNKLTNSSLPKCLHLHIAHQAQPSMTGVPSIDFLMVSHHLAVCPPGVTLSAQDQVIHCQCMKLAHQIVTGVSYPGPCVVSGATSVGKRSIEQTSANTLVTGLNTASGSSTTSSSPSTTSSSPSTTTSTSSSPAPSSPVSGNGSGSVGIVCSVVLLLLTSLLF